jgi:hypothetical protein
MFLVPQLVFMSFSLSAWSDWEMRHNSVGDSWWSSFSHGGKKGILQTLRRSHCTWHSRFFLVFTYVQKACIKGANSFWDINSSPRSWPNPSQVLWGIVSASWWIHNALPKQNKRIQKLHQQYVNILGNVHVIYLCMIFKVHVLQKYVTMPHLHFVSYAWGSLFLD